MMVLQGQHLAAADMAAACALESAEDQEADTVMPEQL